MGLREQLQQQAASIRQQSAARSDRTTRDREFYRQHSGPALQAAADYFRTVVSDLEVVQPSVRFTLPIGPRTDPNIAFRQGSYRLAVDGDDEISGLSVTARCEMNAVISRHIDDLREADAYEQMLRERGLAFFRRRSEDLRGGDSESSHFTVEGGMPSGFRLTADLPGRRIRVQTHNLEEQPLRLHLLRPQRFDEELFESLGRLLLREQDHLVFTEVSAQVRERLRRQICAREQAQLAHQAAREAQRAAQLRQGSLALLKDRVRSATGRLSDLLRRGSGN